MDTYQPIYDAVRSRIHGGDIGSAVEGVMRSENIGHHFAMMAETFRQECSDRSTPSAIFRPTLTRDGDSWIALYGEDLQSGVVGTGDTPAKAMYAFDIAWTTKPADPARGALR